MISTESVAIEMYAAYGKVTDYKNYQGLPMPAWEDLGDKIREAWMAAAARAIELVFTPVES